MYMKKHKLRIILAAVLTLAMIFTAGAQSQKLNLPDTKMPVSSIFQQIRLQTHLGVAYRTDQIDPERVVTLPAKELTLEQVMALITEGTDLDGVIDGNVIVFMKKKAAAAVAVAATKPTVADGFRPTPLSEFRESLGLRPKKVLIEGDKDEVERLKAQMQREALTVPIEMPMLSHRFPANNYTVIQSELPRFALKTNLLYDFAVLTPNISFELGLGKKTSLELGVSYRPWGWKVTQKDIDNNNNKKLVHMIVKPEFRYWLCERFDGHFFGVHLLYARYNIDGHRVASLFGKKPLFSRDSRYNGHAAGIGLTYGYNLPIHKRWSAEFAVGLGAARLWYDQFECGPCNRNANPGAKWYFGPTNASISLVFLLK
jgi:hypothetical protein